MRKIKLSKNEKNIEDALVKGEYVNVDRTTFREIAQAVYGRKKDAVLNLRINSDDLASLKSKARKLGIKYQTFIAEILHRVAHS
jgi:predicted DNA binding CopG/RHH family protein